jgi:iron complex outermembrane receptor protein
MDGRQLLLAQARCHCFPPLYFLCLNIPTGTFGIIRKYLMQTKSKIFAALLCAASSVAYAATDEKEALSEIVVTASRFEESSNHVPANVKVITREDIENSSSNNIPEVLSQIGGLVVSNNSSEQLGLGASVDMGGYGANASSTTLILLDGQRLNPIDSSSVSWESIPLGSVQRIEIFRGGASVQYGNGAVGGVINVITKDGGANINNVTVKAGSFGTVMSNVVLSLGSGDTALRLNANTSNTNGWRDYSAANLYSVGAKLTEYLAGRDEVHLAVYASHSNAQFPGGVVGEVGQGNTQAAKFNNIGSANVVDNTSALLGGGRHLNDTLTFEGEAVYTSKKSNFDQPYYPYVNDLQNWSWSLTPRVKADWGKWGTTIAGFDINKSNAESDDSYGDIGSATLFNHSPYIMERFPLTSSVEVSGGARRQTQSASAYSASPPNTASASQTYSANAADLAVNFSYLDGQKTFIKWNQSFRFPNTDEFWGYNNTTYASVFDGILQPQISQTYELGGEWHFAQTQLTASIFQSDTRNEIRLGSVTLGSSIYTNVNDPDTIRRKGIQFDSTTRATSDLTVSVGGKFQRSLYSTGPYSGNTVSLVPDLTLNARANYALANHWSVGGVVTYIGSQYYDGDESNAQHKMPSATVADVYSSYQSGPWEGRFTVKNLAGANYATSGGYGFVSLPNGSSATTYYYYPGNPRAYYLTLKYAF